MLFNYFYGEEADQFAFFRIPKVLMKASRYAGLRLEAKLLYGLMLDRMELSRKNGWIDEEGRVFIIYKNESVMQDLPCSRQNAVLFLKQLEDAGLIKRVRRGQGLPSIIYVLKFASESNDTDHSNPEGGSENSPERTERPEVKNNALLSKTGSEGVSEGVEQQEVKNNTLTLQTGSEGVSEGVEQQEAKCAYQAVKKDTKSAKNKTFRRRISRSSKTEFLEVPNTNLMNHTDYNYTDSESIYPSNTIYNRRTDRTADMPEKKKHESVMAAPAVEALCPAVEALCPAVEALCAVGKPAAQHEVPVSPESIRAQIDYDALVLDMPDSRQLDDVVSIIGDVLNARQTTTYKIHGNTMSADKVKGRFKGLTSKHIKFVLDSINSITYGIRNIRAYMISALYTATQTINIFNANAGNIGKESPYRGSVGVVRINKFNDFDNQREIDFDEMEKLAFGY